MYRLTLHYTYRPEDGCNPDDFVARGNTLSAACQDLLRQVEEFFAVDADASIWEACLHVVRDSDPRLFDTGDVYQHRDFSMPEQAFDLTIVEYDEVYQRDHNCPLCKLELERAAGDVPESDFGNMPTVE